MMESDFSLSMYCVCFVDYLIGFFLHLQNNLITILQKKTKL